MWRDEMTIENILIVQHVEGQGSRIKMKRIRIIIVRLDSVEFFSQGEKCDSQKNEREEEKR